jgi:phosphoenolpyruvate carboxykinase (ATP)
MPIAATRAMLHAALSGELDAVDYRTDEVFGVEVPLVVPGVDASLLDPRSTWRDPSAYDTKARELARMFRQNFERFDDPERAAAGPRGRS